MSIRHHILPRRSARLAVQLSREEPGTYATLRDLADDAVALLALGDAARVAIVCGRPVGPIFEDAQAVARKYDGLVIPRADVAGMVLGIRFASGRFRSGFNHVYFVA